MITPIGIELKTGQRWIEVDPRFERFVRITGWDQDKGKVQLNGKTWASIKRFNGKRSGYKHDFACPQSVGANTASLSTKRNESSTRAEFE